MLKPNQMKENPYDPILTDYEQICLVMNGPTDRPLKECKLARRVWAMRKKMGGVIIHKPKPIFKRKVRL